MIKRWSKILLRSRKILKEEGNRPSITNCTKLLFSSTWWEPIIFHTTLTLSRQLQIAKPPPTLLLTVIWCVIILINIMVSHMASSIRLLILTGPVVLPLISTIQTASILRCRKLKCRLQPEPIINTITIHSTLCTLKWAQKMIHLDITIVVSMILVKKSNIFSKLTTPSRIKLCNKKSIIMALKLSVTINTSISHSLTQRSQLCKSEAGRLQTSKAREWVARFSRFPQNGRPADRKTIQIVAVWAVLPATAPIWIRGSKIIRSVRLFGKNNLKTLALNNILAKLWACYIVELALKSNSISYRIILEIRKKRGTSSHLQIIMTTDHRSPSPNKFL